MRARKHQTGIGMLGLAYLLGTAGLMVFVFLKAYPIYLNEMKLERAVRAVATEMDPAAEVGSRTVREALQRWWNVEDIEVVKVTDIKVKPAPGGKVMTYDYWNQIELFKNVYLSFHFVKEFPVGGKSTY
jgi:hypothetical protein